MSRVRRNPSFGKSAAAAQGRQVFPVALYASLLVAVLALVQPAALRMLESACATLQVLPLRAQSLIDARVVRAADEAEVRRLDAAVRAVDALRSRRAAAARRRPAGVPSGYVGWSIPVQGRGLERGRAGASELRLAVSRASLPDGVAPFVTVGDVLIGFLAPPDVFDEEPDAGARVRLLHASERGRLPRRVPAWIAAEDGPLPVVVEPASTIDAQALRCVLPADPYRAATIGAGEPEVLTSGLADDPLGPLPRGLRIGTLRVEGYRDAAGDVVPIGLFVEPARPPDSIHAVVVWVPGGAAAAPAPLRRPLDLGVLFAARSSRLPVASSVRTRWFVTTEVLAHAWLREGAALVHGERLVGVLATAGLGYGVVAPFGQPGRSWPLTLLPAGGGSPVDLTARGLCREGTRVVLTIDGLPPEIGSGLAFTGASIHDVPAGLFLGAYAVVDSADGPVVEIDHVEPEQVSALAVFRHGSGEDGLR
jgi:hypothetical protein